MKTNAGDFSDINNTLIFFSNCWMALHWTGTFSLQMCAAFLWVEGICTFSSVWLSFSCPFEELFKVVILQAVEHKAQLELHQDDLQGGSCCSTSAQSSGEMRKPCRSRRELKKSEGFRSFLVSFQASTNTCFVRSCLWLRFFFLFSRPCLCVSFKK